MQIILIGSSCFKIKGKELDLSLGFLGTDVPKTKVDIVVAPDQKQSSLKMIEGEPFVINAPGEYEIADVSVFGIGDVYVIEMDEIRLCYLSKLDSNLSDEQLKEMDGVDVLFISVGKKGMAINQAAKLTKQIQPKILIPMDSEAVDQLLKELGYEEIKRETKLTISKSSLPEEMEAVVLEKKNG